MVRDPSQVEVLGEHDACGVGFIADRLARGSHEWLAIGLEALARLTHRGGGGDGLGAADGCGVLTAIPWSLLADEWPVERSSDTRIRAAGTCLLPPSGEHDARRIVERALHDEGWDDVWWRAVPTDPSRLGGKERESCPAILHLVAWSSCADRNVHARSLYRARLRAEWQLAAAGLSSATITSLSLHTIVYKALVSPRDLPRFLPDLRDPRYATPFVVFHQRFSTNTFPDWAMAQPFHLLAHNGEINTIVGNRLKALRRQADAASLPELQGIDQPAVRPEGSDSRSLDDQAALLVQGGLTLPHAVARSLRRAWEQDRSLTADERAFEQYQSCVGDSWEGPAAIALSDGRHVGLVVDRSGFRPARVLESHGGLIVAASETGVVDLPERDIASRRRVGAGEMLFVDLEKQHVLHNRAVRRELTAAHPYRDWVAQTIVRLPSARRIRMRAPVPVGGTDGEAECVELRGRQRLFAYTAEEIELILRPMLEQGVEAVGSMGDDTPLAALSTRARLLPDFFRQRFAQVTNPPLDSLRERVVMSLSTTFGQAGRALDETCVDARMIAAESPILTRRQLLSLSRLPGRPSVTLPMLFAGAGDAERQLRTALDELVAAAMTAVRQGAVTVVLSDRGSGATQAAIPALLATSAVHHALARAGLGTRAALVVDTGEARDAHQAATLLAFGAAAVCPWLAYDTAATLSRRAGLAPETAAAQYRGALEQGLLKILSKMGVCTIDAYRGSQLFEIIGLDRQLVAGFFPSTAHVAGAVSLDRLAWEAQARYQAVALKPHDPLPHPGFHGYRKDGDHHVFNPVLVRSFHHASKTGSPDAFERFSTLLQSRPPTAVRDLLAFVPHPPVPLDEVEPIDSICTRFFASAMSVGALGPEAHRTLAIAMNRLGGRSNSGEGGEEPDRYGRGLDGRAWANSVTKQVASARFGVTPAYLSSASELQIKMAQGSKPGEGGQLPAPKVVEHIARLRHAQPGTPLISPAPHHDIYSIEDLAQLIYDLRSFHPTARINVKLVSTLGVGIIAAGVVKAGADAIQISGHAGGTGASPRGSIKHAGLPWEIGLAEVHHVLSARGTRGGVVLQTDGGLVTGRDIAMAAALGADEYGFGTAALVALGCVMARQCHLNTCPVGIATQRPDLRAKFAGSVDEVISYLRLVAAETRTILSALGLRSLRELVGRSDLLMARPGVPSPAIDVRSLLTPAEVSGGAGWVRQRDEPLFEAAGDLTLNRRLFRRAGRELGRSAVLLQASIRNTDRSIGATLAGAIARQHGDAGTRGAPVHIALTGDAGQSLGAFTLPGMEIRLRGTANDGVAKGMHGGLITVAASVPGRTEDVLVGNAALYGATGGRLFVAGRAGDRFAVRNSGALAVVEGVGHHGCEYMTGGTVIVLGSVGANFAAGMTGGLAFVYDPDRLLAGRLNRADIFMQRAGVDRAAALAALVQEHCAQTGSEAARQLLSGWTRAFRAFQVVIPKVVGGLPDVVEASPARPDRRGRVRANPRGRVTDTSPGLAV